MKLWCPLSQLVNEGFSPNHNFFAKNFIMHLWPSQKDYLCMPACTWRENHTLCTHRCSYEVTNMLPHTHARVYTYQHTCTFKHTHGPYLHSVTDTQMQPWGETIATLQAGVSALSAWRDGTHVSGLCGCQEPIQEAHRVLLMCHLHPLPFLVWWNPLSVNDRPLLSAIKRTPLLSAILEWVLAAVMQNQKLIHPIYK